MKNNRHNLRPKSNFLKIGDVIPEVKENFGIENILKIQALNNLWPLVTSFETAKYSYPSYFDKENNLVINTKSNLIACELSLQKNNILKKIQEAIRNTDIKFKDIRFISRE